MINQYPLTDMTSELIAQSWHKARNAWMTQTRHGTQEQADAAAIEALSAALRAQAEQPAEGGPVASLYVGSEWGQELQDWEIEANQKVCERLNEQHAGNPSTITLYARPDPRVAELEGLLREAAADKYWANVVLKGRIEAALGEG